MDNLTIRPGLRQFVYLQENKLREYDDKKGFNTWLDQDIVILSDKLQKKYDEFISTIDYHPVAVDYFFDKEAAKQKLIDLANRCMMLWDKIK